MKSHKLIRAVLPLAAGILPSSVAAEEPAVSLPQSTFVVIGKHVATELPDAPDSLFESSAQGIHFALNRTELIEDQPFVSHFRNDIAPNLRDRGFVLRRIVVKGAASPEGPYENNCRLSDRRARQLVEFISKELGDTSVISKVEVTTLCEDYGQLVNAMQKAGDPELADVKRIYEEYGDDDILGCKKALMALNGGTTWKRLMRTYFADLRQARVMMWFGAPLKDTTAVVTEPVSEQATALPYGELSYFETTTAKRERLPLIAVRTNLIHDFFYMPNFGRAWGGNLQLEYFPLKGHYTYNIGFTFTNHRHWQDYKFFQIRDLQLEVRRYFKKGLPYRGLYLGAYAQGFMYGIGFGKDKGWEGEGGGAGITAGYTLKLIRSGHLRMEFMVAVGFLFSKYDPYIYGNPITGREDELYYYDYTGRRRDFQKRNYTFTWFGPTNLGIQLTYDLIYRKRK